MKSKNITLKVNTKLYNQLRKLCEEEWTISHQFKKYMEAELKKRGR